MRTIKELSHDTFYKMEKYSQITIDYVEIAENIITEELDESYTQEDKNRDLSSTSADIYLLLEVINPELVDDINMLNELQSILEDKLKNVKF